MSRAYMCLRQRSFNMSGGEREKSSDKKTLPPAAKRALAEAEDRRARADAEQKTPTEKKEIGGPKGEEPTRYGDWERNGRAVDF